MARQIRAGAYHALDKSRLPNLKNLDPQLLALAATADPGNAHGVPYLWSVTGIGFNLLNLMLLGALYLGQRRRLFQAG